MKFSFLIIGIFLGGIITFFGYYTWSKQIQNSTISSEKSAEKKPLYWVAPMDANYKRDKPGKSPMGMDLIPFYGNQGSGPDEGAGTIKISSAVINNLGVRTSLVEFKTLHSRIDTVGYVNFDENYLIHIHPRVKGWIEKLYVKASGDPVKKGQALYEIYSPEMVNAQEELLLALDRKNPRLIKAAKNKLLSLQVPSSAIQEVEKTRKVKQTVTFYSPQDGIVDNLKIRQGFYVQPGTTIMSIGSLKKVWISAEVFERQASQIAIGTAVDMTLEYLPGTKWNGVVDYIYPTLDTKTRTIKVRVKFDNKDELLKPGMFAQVALHGKKSPKTLTILKEAVIRTGNSNRVVLALGEGKFKSINVEIGRYDEKYAQILSGLKEGERVVTSAQFLLDSESSKTSDFKRMETQKSEESKTIASMDSKPKDTLPKEWASATIIKIIAEDNKIKVKHSAIKNWKWPEMTMNFVVADSIDFTQFKENMSIDIEISKTKNNKYIISDIRPSSEKK